MSSTPKSNKRQTPKGAGLPARHPFDPIIFPDSRLLILGSFPSLQSFENNFYYAHPRNQFWPILGDIFQLPVQTDQERIALLESVGLALWDVVGTCLRVNSADSNLKACEPNDIEGLLKRYSCIEAVLFTGKKAQSLYRRHFKHLSLPTALLPSPSPAYAVMGFEAKKEQWRAILLHFLRKEPSA